MANTLQLAANITSGNTPDALALGEVAINTADKKLWVGTNNTLSGNVLLYVQSTAYADNNTTYSVQDGQLSENSFTNADHTKLNGIATSATNTAAPFYTSAIGTGDGKLTTKNFTAALKTKLDGIATSATNTAAPYYTAAIGTGDGKLTTKDFTAALKTKLDGVATSATNTAAPYYTAAIGTGDGKLTQKDFTPTLKTKLDGIATGATNFTCTLASLGGITAAYAEGLISDVVDSAPAALNTLNELAAALGDDSNYASTITTALAGKLGSTAKAADSNLLDGVDSAKYLKGYGNVSGWQNSNANFSIRSGSSSVGLHMEGSSGEFGFQLYSSGSTYGFLDGEWAGWDIRKAENGNFEVDEGSGLKHVWNAGNVTAGTGISITANTISCTVTDTNTTYSVGDGGLTTKNFTAALKTKLDGIATSATNTAAPYYTSAIGTGDGKLTTKNFTSALKTKLDGIATSATNTAAPYYTAAIGTGDGKLTTKDFTAALKTKLDGVATSANNYSFPYTVSQSASNSTVVQRHSSGYIFSNYINTTANVSTSLDHISGKGHGDTYHRWYTAATVRTFLNVANGATNTAAPYYTSAIGTGDGKLTTKDFTAALKTKLDGIATSATNTAAPYYTSAIGTGDGGLTTKNFTSALKTKLDGIATSATNTAAPFYTAAIGTGDGKLTTKDFTAALKTKLDGIATGATNTAAPHYTSAIGTGDGKLTTKDFTAALKTKLDGIATSANNYSFPYTVSASQSASTVVQRNSSGYVHAVYFNGTGTFSTGDAGAAMGMFTGTNGSDTYGRSYNASRARTLLNVADGATNTSAPYYTAAIGTGDGKLTTKDFTSALKTKLDGIATSATNTAAPFYTAAIGTGDGKLTTKNFTSTLKTKLDGIATGATNTVGNATHSGDVSGSTTLTIGAGKVEESMLHIADGGADANGNWLIKRPSLAGGMRWETIGGLEESHMNISNAGSNGQVLTRRSGNSGGWTWETASGGGTTSWNGLENISALTTLP